MTSLVQDLPGDHLFVRAVGKRGIRVGDNHYQRSIILSGNTLIDDWPPQSVTELAEEHFSPIFGLEPEIVLLGLGANHPFLHPERLAEFYRREVGIELMATEAACRTFNVLVMDGRKVVAGLLPLNAV